MTADQIDLELMVASAYRIVEGRAFTFADALDRANYRAAVEEFIEDIKAERIRQAPEQGQKEVA